jgi:hypothetical protein
MKQAALLSLFTFLLHSATSNAQVVGSPSGFAAGTTGGGDAEPQTPTSLDEYVLALLPHLKGNTNNHPD